MERMVAQSNLLIFLRLLTIIRFRLLFLFWLIHVSFKLCTRGSAKKVLSRRLCLKTYPNVEVKMPQNNSDQKFSLT